MPTTVLTEMLKFNKVTFWIAFVNFHLVFGNDVIVTSFHVIRFPNLHILKNMYISLPSFNALDCLDQVLWRVIETFPNLNALKEPSTCWVK